MADTTISVYSPSLICLWEICAKHSAAGLHEHVIVLNLFDRKLITISGDNLHHAKREQLNNSPSGEHERLSYFTWQATTVDLNYLKQKLDLKCVSSEPKQ